MQLRLHFTAEDLARTRVVVEPDPMWELALSLHVLTSARTPGHCRDWRNSTLAAFDRRRDGARLSLLTTVNPSDGPFPDFITPGTGHDGFAAGLDAVLHTPAARVRREIEELTPPRRSTPVARALIAGEAGAMRALGGAMHWYYETALAVHWPRIRRLFGGDRAQRMQDLSIGGVERLLAGLPGVAGWRSPVLHVDYPVDHDIHLGGRGLTVVPSYFCYRTPVTLIDEELPPVLVYPIVDTSQPVREFSALTDLIGGTRALALHALREPRSTTGLAKHIQTSLASASKHAAVLRAAGLITSTRRGNTVMHLATPLGAALIDVNAAQQH